MEKNNKPIIMLHKKDRTFWKKNSGMLVKLIIGGTAILARICIERSMQKIDEKVAEFAEDQKLGYHEHAALRLICRSRLRDRDHMIQDLEKAAWYISRSIAYKKKMWVREYCENVKNGVKGSQVK